MADSSALNLAELLGAHKPKRDFGDLTWARTGRDGRRLWRAIWTGFQKVAPYEETLTIPDGHYTVESLELEIARPSRPHRPPTSTAGKPSTLGSFRCGASWARCWRAQRARLQLANSQPGNGQQQQPTASSKQRAWSS